MQDCQERVSRVELSFSELKFSFVALPELELAPFSCARWAFSIQRGLRICVNARGSRELGLEPSRSKASPPVWPAAQCGWAPVAFPLPPDYMFFVVKMTAKEKICWNNENDLQLNLDGIEIEFERQPFIFSPKTPNNQWCAIRVMAPCHLEKITAREGYSWIFKTWIENMPKNRKAHQWPPVTRLGNGCYSVGKFVTMAQPEK